MSTVSWSKSWPKNTSLKFSLSEVLVSTTGGAVPLFFVVELDSLSVGSPHIVLGTTFSEKGWTKAEFGQLGTTRISSADPCESFEGFGRLN